MLKEEISLTDSIFFVNDPNFFIFYNSYLNQYCSKYGEWHDISYYSDNDCCYYTALKHEEKIGQIESLVVYNCLIDSVNKDQSLYRVPAYKTSYALRLLGGYGGFVPYHDDPRVEKMILLKDD